MKTLFTYDEGTFEIADVGDKVIYVNHNIENNNLSRSYYGSIGTWYEVLKLRWVMLNLLIHIDTK